MFLEGIFVFMEPRDTESLSEYRTWLAEVQQQIQDIQEIVDELELDLSNCKLPQRSGPVSSRLNDALRKNKIAVQAYHGRSFVGNHCHRYLKKETFTSICDSVIESTVQMTDNIVIHHMADDCAENFKTLNGLYSAVHKGLSHTLPLVREEMPELGDNIRAYMSFFRATFPGVKVTPKQHILECHSLPFM